MGEGLGVRDDLGRRLLSAHPRGEVWRQLDVSVAALNFDQLDGLSRRLGDAAELTPARTRLIAGITDTELLGRLGSRWVRWADTFGLPQPDPAAAPRELLEHPYRLTDSDVEPDYLRGAVAIFDAGLGIAAAGTDDPGAADYQLLTAPWRWACLPSRFTPTDAYGPHTQQGLALLRRARDAGPAVAARVLAARQAMDPDTWVWARDQVSTASIDCGFPFRGRCLFWEAVPAAEDAAEQSPTDPALAEALWAAAASTVFTGQLPTRAAAVLAQPWLDAGQQL